MKASFKKKDMLPVEQLATGFVDTMYFGLDGDYLGGRTEQITIVPDAPENWESETCKLIPYVRYEYTRVSKTNPETKGSGLARINRGRKRVLFLISVAKNNGTVLRVVKDTIVTRLQPTGEAIRDLTLIYTEDSLGSLNTDKIGSENTTREIPSHLKGIKKK